MIKKIFIFCLCLLALFVSVGGTVAYLVTANETNETKNIDIIQYRMERTGSGLKTYSNSDTVHPGVYGELNSFKDVQLEGYYPNGTEVKFWDSVHNTLDRIVSVQNNGNVPVFVRTLYAFNKAARFEKNVVTKIDDKQVWQWEEIGVIEIEGIQYELVEAVYVYDDGVLDTGEFTYPSLLEVVMNKDVKRENDEDSNEIKIYVKSQAVSTQDIQENEILNNSYGNTQETLDAVLGEITVNNHPFE